MKIRVLFGLLLFIAMVLPSALARGITPPDAIAGHGAEALQVFLAYSVDHDPASTPKTPPST